MFVSSIGVIPLLIRPVMSIVRIGSFGGVGFDMLKRIEFSNVVGLLSS